MSAFRFWYRSQPVALRTIIAINVVFYLVWALLLSNIPLVRGFVWGHLALHPELPGILLEPWQLVTYNFLHLQGFFHMVFNMLWLWWIGREFEDLHGAHHMLSLYIIGGVGGGLFSVLGYSMLGSAAVIHGASASVLALMTAVVTLYPQKRIGLLFLGAVRLLWVVVVFLAIDLLRMLGPTNVAVLAHLGGAAAGFLFAKAQRNGVDLTSWAKVFFSGSGRRRGGGYAPGRSFGTSGGGASGRSGGGGMFGGLFGGGGSAGAPDERETLREERDRKRRQQSQRRREVDRILDKISEKGYEALSDDEKRTLEQASRS